MEEWRKHREQTALVMEGMTSPPTPPPQCTGGKGGKEAPMGSLLPYTAQAMVHMGPAI